MLMIEVCGGSVKRGRPGKEKAPEFVARESLALRREKLSLQRALKKQIMREWQSMRRLVLS
jgi:hypothetical protein